MTLTSLVVWERVIVTQMMSALVTWCVEQIIASEWAVDSRKDQIVVSFLQSKVFFYYMFLREAEDFQYIS